MPLLCLCSRRHRCSLPSATPARCGKQDSNNFRRMPSAATPMRTPTGSLPHDACLPSYARLHILLHKHAALGPTSQHAKIGSYLQDVVFCHTGNDPVVVAVPCEVRDFACVPAVNKQQLWRAILCVFRGLQFRQCQGSQLPLCMLECLSDCRGQPPYSLPLRAVQTAQAE